MKISGRNLGIHIRLLFAVFTLIGAVTFALGYMGINISRQFVQTRFEERMHFLARYLALNAELGILIDDRQMLESLASNLMAEKDIAGVAIFSSSGANLADVSKKTPPGKTPPGSVFVVESPVFLRESEEESKAFYAGYDDKTYEKMIGRVQITCSAEGMEKLLTTMKMRFVWLSTGMACLSLVLFYFISRSLVAPVSRLAQAARQVAGGDFDLRAQPGGLPETNELALAFNAMLDSLESSREALREANERILRQNTLAEMGKFSMMIAHEVKNPLSIIKSSLDILKTDFAFLSSDTMVLYIEDEIMRLNRLIEDFLAFAHPARPLFRRVDMNALLKEIVIRAELYKKGSPVIIDSNICPEPCYANVDSDLIIRAVENILKNAFEANGHKGVVKVGAFRRGDIWTLEIKDQGEGIEPENTGKIFEPFFTTRSKGTGLGLAYVSQVVMAHGGSVTAGNRGQKGAVFHLEIPALS